MTTVNDDERPRTGPRPGGVREAGRANVRPWVGHADLGTTEPASSSEGRRHEHAWQTESAHRTSLGLVRYVRCGGCGGRRVDLQPHPEAPPAALSVPVPPAGIADRSRAGGRVVSGSARE